MTGHVRRACAAFLLALLAAAPAMADPTLTVVGEGREVALDDGDLDALPQRRIATSTPYSDGVPVFAGPLARDVLSAAGARLEGELRFVAANGYSVVIPALDFIDRDVIFATSMDGSRLSLRDKGPIWVMYPLDDMDPAEARRHSGRIIWQLVRVEPVS
ncbi:MAG: hypothetical protein AAF322_14825 [Pseudomonadota bacterium]